MKHSCVLAAAAGILCTSLAQAVVLYDGATGSLAGYGGNEWLAYGALDYSKLPSIVSPDCTTAVAGGTQLATTSNYAISAGWSNYTAASAFKNSAFPTLDPAAGFAVDFRLGISAESTLSVNRAGFSAILLGSDHRGVEIGFSQNSLFALKLDGSNAFVKDTAVTASRDNSASSLYHLSIQGGTFTLSSGSSTILTGATYDYRPWTPGPAQSDPYELPSYLFLGDDTTSASSTSILSYVAVPEPAGLAGAVLAAGALLRRRGRR